MSDRNNTDTPETEQRPPMLSRTESPDPRTTDLHHNQDTAVRPYGDQPPEETPVRDRDRLGTPSITPGS